MRWHKQKADDKGVSKRQIWQIFLPPGPPPPLPRPALAPKAGGTGDISRAAGCTHAPHKRVDLDASITFVCASLVLKSDKIPPRME